MHEFCQLLHGAELVVQCSWNDSKQITLLDLINYTDCRVISVWHGYMFVFSVLIAIGSYVHFVSISLYFVRIS